MNPGVKQTTLENVIKQKISLPKLLDLPYIALGVDGTNIKL